MADPMTTEASNVEGMTADERLRCGIDIDIPKLKAGLRELSDAFVKGRQGSYGMLIPAEPYHDGDLVCGGAFRLIERLEQQLTAARQGPITPVAERVELYITSHQSTLGADDIAFLREIGSALTTAEARNADLCKPCWREDDVEHPCGRIEP
jgi:hypothetical protein